jgi:hypothetical protein
MQYRLSTLFLIFFMVAASLALFGATGLWISGVLLLAALSLNRLRNLKDGIIWAVLIILIGIICPGWLLPNISKAREAARRAECIGHLKQIGLALHNYHDAHKHFPSINTCDKDGKPLYSWRVEILPMMEYGPFYKLWKKDEFWNSSTNMKLSSQFSPLLYHCPSAGPDEKNPITNYAAVIGPGTAWRKDGPVRLSDLPDGGSHAIMLIEVVNSGVHWAEPRDLTVEEALEGLKTGKGLRISTAHPGRINVLFANGTVKTLPSKMPVSLWEKILTGEIKNWKGIEGYVNIDVPDYESARDAVDVSIAPPESGKGTIFVGFVIWLVSVVLLFRRAIKSRKKPATST